MEKINNNTEKLVTPEKLEEWRNNTLDVALRLGADPKLIGKIKSTELLVNSDIKPSDIWYGYCRYDADQISVYKDNLASLPYDEISNILLAIGLDDDFSDTINQIGEQQFHEIFNQSGMDHELIGHMYNYLDNQPHDEPAAVKAQIAMAQFRSLSDENWKAIAKIMPKILKQHKQL